MSFREQTQNLDKRSLLYLGITVLVAVVVFVGLYYYFSKPPEIIIQEQPKSEMRKVIKSLTAPKLGEPISEKIHEDLSVSSESDPLENKEKILNNLTAPK